MTDMMSRGFDRTQPPNNGMPDSGVEQPGSPHQPLMQHSSTATGREKLFDGIKTMVQASDKMAVLNFNLDWLQAYQLLPVDRDRSVATLIVPANTGLNNILVGPQALIDTDVLGNAALGYTIVQGGSPLVYTSKAALYGIALSATKVPMAILVEKFNSGTPVT